MKFADAKTSFERLSKLLETGLGRAVVAELTLEIPTPPEDELHFHKLVMWSYAALYEAAPPALKFLLGLLRVANTKASGEAGRTREDVRNLRTARAHNLPRGVNSNEKTLRQAQLWLDQNGGNPPDWAKCSATLCKSLVEIFERLTDQWERATADPTDRAMVVEQLQRALDKEWAAHEFDPIVMEAAQRLGVSGLDVVKYRQANLDHWRELVSFFEDRETAMAALSAAIHNGLLSAFVVR